MCKSEQTLFFSGLSIAKPSNQINRREPWRNHLKHKHGSFFLAVVLSTAAPAFADRISVDRMDGDRGSVSLQELPNRNVVQDASASRKFGLSRFKEDELRIEFNPAVRMSDFSKDAKISDLGALLNSGSGPNSHQASLFDLGSQHGDSFRWDAEKAERKHHERDRDNDDGPLVAVPEPGSGTLLLFDLAGLGMIVYRRNALKNAI